MQLYLRAIFSDEIDLLFFPLKPHAHDNVIEHLIADGELSFANDFKPGALVECDGAVVLVIGAEQHPLSANLAGMSQRRCHQLAAGAGAVIFGKHVNALELDIAGLAFGWRFDGAGDGIADRRAGGGRFGDPTGIVWIVRGDIGFVDFRRVLVAAMLDQVRAGNDFGIAFQERGRANHPERIFIARDGWPDVDPDRQPSLPTSLFRSLHRPR